jgi:transposase
MPARSKHTVPKGDKICELVGHGVTIEAAAQSEGVSKKTVYNWRNAGRKGDPKFVEFAAALDAALAKAEVVQTLNVIKMGAKDWKAAAWWLERRNPEVYGESSKVVHRVKLELEGLLDVAQQVLDPDSYQKLLRAIPAGGDREK